METARMTAPTPIGVVDSTNGGFTSGHHNAAGDNVVDAYATRVLKMKSPSEVCIDESLGPYVTSLLRDALATSSGVDNDVKTIPQYESLMELLEEHCSLSHDAALSALQTIVTAVRTGAIEPLEESDRSNLGSIGSDSPWSTSMGDNQGGNMEPLNLLGDIWNQPSLPANDLGLRDPASISSLDTPQEIAPESSSSRLETRRSDVATENDDPSTSSMTTSATPLKPDRLIPVDLMGVLDDPSTPTSMKGRYKIDAFEVAPPQCVPTSSAKKGASRKNSKEEAKDLAAALFRPARARQNEIDGEAKSPKLMPKTGNYGLHATNLEPSAVSYYASTEETQLFHHQLDSAVEILLSMNPDLGEEAASEAALVADVDLNVAQYVIDGALAAPPVCRHMLKDGCYRSDCQFSHDVEGHTCLFWLRGRCGKGDSCRFLHGYSRKLLEGIKTDLLPEHQNDETPSNGTGAALGAKSEPLPIQTTNLVEHNANMSFSAPQHSGSPFTFMSSSSGFETSAFTFPPQPQVNPHLESSPWEPSPLESAMRSLSVKEKENAQATGPSISFACIASQGYSKASFSAEPQPGGIGSALAASASNGHTPPQKANFVKIPQDLWNPHQNRNSSVFEIPDPLERYREVSRSILRHDVIDLHFQSTKTFQIVLSTILPEKLRDHGEVWVVTGTGHHVGTKTHQKGGGALETAVASWLASGGYAFVWGRDRNGHGGALLVKP